jgi:hypothetical protein
MFRSKKKPDNNGNLGVFLKEVRKNRGERKRTEKKGKRKIKGEQPKMG